MLPLSRKYTKIVSDKQLEQYVADFDAVYADYLESHEYLRDVSRLFERHKQDLDAIQDKHSLEFEKKKSLVFRDYADKQKDPHYMRMRKQNARLAAKLHLIRDLVNTYRSASASTTS